MKGIIVYERAVAAMRASYIEKYYSAFRKRGVDLSLVLTDEPFFTGAGEEWTDGLHNPQPKGIHESRPEGISDFGSGDLHNTKPEPDFAIVRVMDPSISAGLEKRGIRCFNSSRVSALANDKRRTYELVGTCTGVPFMETAPMDAEGMERMRGFLPLVAKPVGGHGGEGIFYIEDEKALDEAGAREGYILQQCSSDPGRDVRVYLLGGRARIAMERRNARYSHRGCPVGERLLSNFTKGGSARVYDLDADPLMAGYVRQIAGALGADLAGVDFIFHEGRPVFNEIEDVVGSRMLYGLTDIDIVDEYADYICSQMG